MTVHPLRRNELSAPRAICIESDPIDLRLMEAVLRTLGFKVGLYANAEEGLQEIRQQPPDVVLMDVNLPGMSGFTAVSIIRGTPGISGLPVIATSCRESARDAARGEAAGFTHYVTKPIDISGLQALLSAFAERGT